MQYKNLTQQQIENYHRDGYTIIKNFFSPEEAELMYQTAILDKGMEENSYDLNDKTGKKTKLALWYNLGDDIFGKAIRSKRMVDSVEKLIGGTPAHYHTKLMQKEPKVGGAWEWHQDYGYWYKSGFLFPDMLSVMIALSEANKSNGCLQVLKGSHKLGRVEHGFEGDQIGVKQNLINEVMDYGLELVHVELEPGDTLFFHSNTLHTSSANLSDKPRWSLISAYNLITNKPYLEVHPSCTEPIDVVPNEEIIKTKPSNNTKRDYLNAEKDISLK